MIKPKRKICHFGRCAYPATHGFKSKKGNIQDQQYCHKHAKEMRDNRVFPKCKMHMIKLWNFSLTLEPSSSQDKKEEVNEIE